MSEKTVFISYRRDVAGKFFARSILGALTQLGYDVFLDVDCIDAGEWARQILTQVPKRSHFLLLITPGALERCADENDWVRKEWLAAIASKRNVVPVREETVDLAALKKVCADAMLGIFDLQIATVQHATFEGSVETLVTRYIAPRMAPSVGASREPANNSRVTLTDISRILKYAPDQLIGREQELELLNDAWRKVQQHEKGRPHILTFVALGGEGKTSLVAKWAAELAHQDWPGCDTAFAWSFYSQGTRDQVAASSDLFLKEALIFFGDDADKEFAASSAGAHEKGQRLARIVGRQRALLVLDGLEPLQYAPTSPTPGQLKDQGIAALLKGLATASQGLCVVTTRYSVPELKAFWQTTAPEVKLLRLSCDAGVHLLRALGVKGTAKECETLVEDVKGHALTLTLLGGFLKRAFHGDIRQRDRVKFEKADEKMDGGHAYRTMAAYEQWLLLDGGDEGRREVAVLRLMGLFDRPADAACVAALRSETIPSLTEPLDGLADDDWEFCLSGLEATKLLTVNRDMTGALVSLDAHPHLREYFAKQLREQNPDAWRAAHRRLYEHLCKHKEGEQPTLEDLQPLYQAVAHGCQAGLQGRAIEGVYYERIRRGNEHYAPNKLGAWGLELGAISCFFEHPWIQISPGMETWQTWLLNEAAHTLRALGRLAEAVDPMRLSGELDASDEQWEGAAVSFSSLSELQLALGDVAEAMRGAERSVICADRSGEADWQSYVITNTTYADVLHHAGRPEEAEPSFRKCEAMQSQYHPTYPLLYSFQGFEYCDLLLAQAERSAWRSALGMAVNEELLSLCDAVSKRATQTFEWAEQLRLDINSANLDHLTLARSAFYVAVVSSDSQTSYNSSPSPVWHLEAALNGFREGGVQLHIPRGLLSRAWIYFVTDHRKGHESARRDLDEAWEISERSSMKLHMADIHLYRARLFFREEKYPWDKNSDGTSRGPKDDLVAAERLINECGYHRRDEELADAKKAILGQ
ncbi:MAG: toll/interleukin-1 receptor domain-containing protein [Flavobacteriales bacterium]